MKRWALKLLFALAALLAIPLVISALMNRPLINDAIRRFNREKLNPWMLRRAGKGDWYASTIETRGRKTDETRRTPVVADPVSGGFVIPLPYGTDVDWLQNARAAGHATIHRHDVDYPVDDFEIVDAAAALGMLTPRRRMAFRLNRIDQFLKATIEHETFEPV